ncbi:hypothetical protein BH23BAC4_BH23BAC4_08650 [soil metagenome]
MATDPSESTVVVASYPARHYAEMAKDFLADNGIASFIVADDVHVPLQLTDGARLSVLESTAQAAYAALERAGFLPENITEDPDSEGDEGED